jgi:hypothetical protein
LWLNYASGSNPLNRIIIKKCERNQSVECEQLGCGRTMDPNESTQVRWNLVANIESANLKNQTEQYSITLNRNPVNLKSYWNQTALPNLTVEIIYYKLIFLNFRYTNQSFWNVEANVKSQLRKDN